MIDVLNAWIEGVDAKIAWHSCLGAGYGNTFRTVEDALPRVLERWQEVNVEQYALDFALRDMADVHALKEIAPDKEVQVGVIDIRTLYIETDDEIVARIHKVLEHIEPERVYLTTDCGLKALPRFCAIEKLKALSRAAARVRERDRRWHRPLKLRRAASREEARRGTPARHVADGIGCTDPGLQTAPRWRDAAASPERCLARRPTLWVAAHCRFSEQLACLLGPGLASLVDCAVRMPRARRPYAVLLAPQDGGLPCPSSDP